jgi:hypothetical protein
MGKQVFLWRFKMKKKNIWMINSGVICILVIAFVVNVMGNSFAFMDMDEKRDHFISMKNSIQEDLMPQHNYRCCLEKPCTYCIEKTPGHGEGAECDCLSDVVNGVHPCGECIGEILEGHGNPYLAEYFAKAIAEKTGQEGALKKIIEEKYGIPVEEQA